MAEVESSPFIKQLAANDRPTRDKAVESLRTYLSGRRELTELELLKLWKGLFYCVWMSDRPLTQQRLVASLADLVPVIHEPNLVPFLAAFWTTMAQKWTSIDVLRMEKFLLLVRAYVGASFRWLGSKGWDEGLVAEHSRVVKQGPLHPTERKTPDGLRYHVLDIWVDELDKADTPRSGLGPRLGEVMGPVRELAEGSKTRSVRERAREVLGDERLAGWEKVGDDEKGEEEEAEEWSGIEG